MPHFVSAATLFSDDFDDNSIDAEKWTEADPDSRIAETGGKIVLSGSTASTTALISTQTFGRVANLTMIATVRHTLPYVLYGFKDSSADYRAANFRHAIYFGPGAQIIPYENGATRTSLLASSVYSNNTDYRIALILKEYGADYYIQGGAFGTFGSDDWSLIYSSNCITVCSTDTDLRVGFAGTTAFTTAVMSMDNFSVVDNGLDATHHAFEFSSLMVNNPTANSVTLVAKTSTTSDITVNYGLTDLYGSTAVSSDQKIHKVSLSGLSGDTTYHYQIVAVDQTGSGRIATSTDSTFKTQSTSGNKNFNFTVVSDNQGSNPSTTASLISSLDHSFILHPGDNVHVDNETTQAGWSHSWDKDWAYYFKNITKNIPSYYAQGNHDTIGYSHTVDYAATLAAARAEMAMPAVDGAEEFYYSFDYENMHVAVLDTSLALFGATQQAWLESDLAATTKKWKVIMMHVPGNIKTGVYSISSVADKNALHSLAVEYGVQVILSGHSHVYHRWVKD
ncbi:MAG: metallophosphoesterase, partial [Candidatus Paceibacterota bacterium]